MVQTGANGLSLDALVDLKLAAETVPENIGVIGNIDPVRTMKQCDAPTVRQQVLDLKAKMAEHKNFIASTGCDLPHTIPLENLHAFIDALKN